MLVANAGLLPCNPTVEVSSAKSPSMGSWRSRRPMSWLWRRPISPSTTVMPSWPSGPGWPAGCLPFRAVLGALAVGRPAILGGLPPKVAAGATPAPPALSAEGLEASCAAVGVSSITSPESDDAPCRAGGVGRGGQLRLAALVLHRVDRCRCCR